VVGVQLKDKIRNVAQQQHDGGNPAHVQHPVTSLVRLGHHVRGCSGQHDADGGKIQQGAVQAGAEEHKAQRTCFVGRTNMATALAGARCVWMRRATIQG